MAIGIATRETKVASKVETTEKTYAAPTLATDFFSPIEYPENTIEREAKERVQVTGDIGVSKSLPGMRASGISFSQEFRGSGTAGTEPEWGRHAKAVLGTVVNRTSDVNTSGSSTTTVLTFAAGDLTNFKTLDAVLVKDSTNGYSVRFVKHHGNGETLTSSNNKLDINEGSGEQTVSVATGSYSSPSDLAAAVELALNSDSSLSGDYSCSYSETTAQFTISRSGGNFSILWSTGTNGSGGTDNHIGTVLGYDDSADDSGASSYLADNDAHADITIAPALDSAPASGTAIGGASTYKRINSGHDSLSFTIYQGDEIESRLVGCKGTQMNLANAVTGEIPQLDFTFQGLTYSAESDSSASITPDYQNQLPPLALGVDFEVDGTDTKINDFTMEVAQQVTKVLAQTDDDGACFQFASRVEVTGTYNPWADDTTFDEYTDFDANTDRELIWVCGEKDSSDNWVPGSVVAIYLPQTRIATYQWEDADGLLRRALAYQAHRGNVGEDDEIAVAAL